VQITGGVALWTEVLCIGFHGKYLHRQKLKVAWVLEIWNMAGD
jgi:hypothetical protein